VALGIADFGRAFYFGIALANSARAGAAYASQSNAKTSDNTGIKQAAANEGQSIGLTTNNVATQQTCKCATTSPQPCGTTSWNCPTIVQPEVYVKVTTQDTFRTLVNYPGIPSPIIMTRSATLRVQ
jgi:Flp pilus assembly protein TadG